MAASTNFCGSDVVGVAAPRTLDHPRQKEKAKELVLIEWVDIISDNQWVVSEDCHLPTFYTVGWLEYQDEKVIKIVNTLDFDDALEEHKDKEKPIGYSVTCFPVGCVTSVKYL
jgi:hypothetical protein